jgi:hypothetical protein
VGSRLSTSLALAGRLRRDDGWRVQRGQPQHVRDGYRIGLRSRGVNLRVKNR